MSSTEVHETSMNSTVSYSIRSGIIPSCFPADRPLVDDTSLSYYVGFYVFPIIFVIGVTGNVLNLAVLNSRGMKTKANRFLSAMAVSDLCFLVIMFILNLVNYKTVTTSNGFVWFHFLTKMTFISLANGFSSSSIWFAIIVTIERLVAIRTPLHARGFWKAWRMVLIIGCILFLSFALQLFNLFWLTPESRPMCANRNQRVYFWHLIKEHDNYYLFQYVRFSLIITPILQVTFPMVMLVLLNSLLLYYLWLNRNSVSRINSTSSQNTSGNNKEWKITTTVVIIVVTFLLFNFPSLIMYWLTTSNIVPNSSTSRNLVVISTFLVSVNKALNFILYCTTSDSFRRKLFKLFTQHSDVSSKRVTWLQSITITNEERRNSRGSLTRKDKAQETIVIDKNLERRNLL